MENEVEMITVEPPFTISEILEALVKGEFNQMESQDYEAFEGAEQGSVICYDLKNWIVVISPGPTGQEVLNIQALHNNFFCELTHVGWVKL